MVHNSMKDDVSLLDKILFRSEYKKEIREQDKRIDELNNTIQEKEERISELEDNLSKAVTEKQSAYEKRNKLQDRVAQLEDKIESMEDSKEEFDFGDLKSKKIRGKSNIEEFLNILSGIDYDSGNAHTIYFEEDDGKISEYERFDNAVLRRISPVTVFEDSLSIVRMGVKTPIQPTKYENFGSGFDVDRSIFKPSDNLVFGVVRSDIFAVGLYDEWNCNNIRTVKSNVKNKHSKGGFSQSRFEESRRKQIEEHVKKCKDVLEEVSDDESTVILVGSEQTVSRFEEEADYTGTSDAKGTPKSALKKAFNDFWSVTVFPNI